MRSKRLRIGFLATQFEESTAAVFRGPWEGAVIVPVCFFEGSNARHRAAGALDETAFYLAAMARLMGLIIIPTRWDRRTTTRGLAGICAVYGITMVSLG
jgi:hypothetical protein